MRGAVAAEAGRAPPTQSGITGSTHIERDGLRKPFSAEVSPVPQETCFRGAVLSTYV